MTARPTREALHALPKADLHVHLDGSLRPSTMIELAAEHGVSLPTSDPVRLTEYMHVRDARDLVDYLARFDTTLAVLQTATGLERAAYELAEDAAAENVRYMEVRYSPVLNIRDGLSLEGALAASLRGLRRAEADFDITTGVIVCALRHMGTETSKELARLAVDFRHHGVVAFDLAGPERDHPPKRHVEAFRLAGASNLALTVHAGEAFGPESIHQAIHLCHANRIGHGTRLFEDRELMGYVNDFRIPLEICLTSNVQTRATPDIESHPVRLYYDEGLVVTLNTDNRLMSGTTMTDEFALAAERLDFTWEEVCRMALMGFEAAFLPRARKVAMLDRITHEIEALSSSPAA